MMKSNESGFYKILNDITRGIGIIEQYNLWEDKKVMLMMKNMLNNFNEVLDKQDKFQVITAEYFDDIINKSCKIDNF